MRIPPKSLAIVMERSAGRCEVCGAPGTNTHHRAGRGMGGSKDPRLGLPSNLLRLSGSGSTGVRDAMGGLRTILPPTPKLNLGVTP